MGLLGNGVKTTLGGLAFGVGVSIVAPVIIPILTSIAKPLTKAVIKESLILYGKGKETLAEAKETIDDLVAAAKSEVDACSDLSEQAGASAVASAVYTGNAGLHAKREQNKPPRVRRRKTVGTEQIP